ncbi:MAG: hypothetical protein M9921_09895 [Fimbriimonadaceae bacterium]|nr:hypothetical protein [Chthonomonadaceae bacterium]MCO5297156.1 hypothetical protein [Fimbriimonadaceae bacterium]
MLTSLALLVALQGSSAFTSPLRVQETVRMPLTPRLDGRTSEEEWDRFAVVDGVQTYFQWEPRELHAAAKLPVGQDFVASFDVSGDGWLVGKDNIEARVSWNGGSPKVHVRVLDATDAAGPRWVEDPAMEGAALVGAASSGGDWTVELTLGDAGHDLFPEGSVPAFALRLNGVPATSPSVDPLTARALFKVAFGWERDSGLPEGLKWKPELQARSVVPGDANRIRLTFTGSNDLNLRRIEVRTEGLGREYALGMQQPFPDFDNKGRAFVDYDTKIDDKAPLGYRLVRGTLTDANGRVSQIQCSYQVSEPVSFDVVPLKGVKSKPEEQKIRVTLYVKSHTAKRIDGIFLAEPPSGWTIASGSGGSFLIYNSRGSSRRSLELIAPAGAKGSFPIKVSARIGLLDVKDTIWIHIS